MAAKPPLPPPSRPRHGFGMTSMREPEKAPKLAAGLVVAGKYRLTEVLRHGGMGSVWVATHLTLDSPVAIKFMALAPVTKLGHAESTEDREELASLRARFEREAKAAAQIRSANVVQILDYGIDRGLPYLVMELLKGEDLGARLSRKKRLDLGETTRILAPLARALDRAHQSGLVHRDLKPENVFLCDEDGEEVVKILDFGVAKTLHGGDRQVGTPTLEGTVVGSPHYMSPEQAMGSTEVDHRSDLWSLAVIAFRALTGARPFEGQLLLETVVKICSGPIPSATSVASDLGPDVDAFFRRALSREPNERFQSARELTASLASLAHAQGHDVATLAVFTGTFPATTPESVARAIEAPVVALPKRRMSIVFGAAVIVAAALVTVLVATFGKGSTTENAAGPVEKAAALESESAKLVEPAQSAREAASAVAASTFSARPEASASATTSASATKTSKGAAAAPAPQSVAKKPKRDMGY